MISQRALTAEDICQKLKPIYGNKIDKIYFNYATSESREAKEELLSMMNALYQKHFNELLGQKMLLSPPNGKDVQGDYKIGEVMYGKNNVCSFSLREKDFPRHVCISGMSGSGKTTLAFNVLESLTAKDKPFLVFDWKKSFRPLLAKDEKIACFTIGDNKLANNFKLNLNQPPKGIAPKEWITIICDLIAESFFVSYGVHKILLETLDESFKEWGIYSGSNNYPTWNHIKWRLEEKLEKSKSRAQGWIESALRVATVLTFGDFGEVMNYKGGKSVSVEDIMKGRVIFEMNSLGSIEKKFFCEFILMYIYKLKKAGANGIENSFDYAILVDEAHNIFLKDKTNFTQESVTDMIYREMREYGISLICLDQHISKLSDTVKGNSACHIAFQQQLPDDIDAISRLMHLYDQKELFSSLKVGSAVVKLSERYTKPFSIQAPWTDIRKLKVSESDIKGRVQRFLMGNEFVNNTDKQFNEELKAGKSFDLNKLFSKIHLPKLNLRATQSEVVSNPSNISYLNDNPEKDPTKPLINLKGNLVYDAEKEPESSLSEEETVYATIKKKIDNGEELNDIEKKLEFIYNPVAVNKAVNRVFEEQLSKKMTIRVKEASIPQNEFFESENNEGKGKEEKTIIEEVPMSIDGKSDFLVPKMPLMLSESGIPIEKCNMPLKHRGNKGEQKLYKTSLSSSKHRGLSDEESKFITFLESNPDHGLTTVNLYKAVGFSPRKGNKIKNLLVGKELLKVQEIKYNKGWKKIIRLN